MIEYPIKRLWNGLASVRDYIVEKALRENQILRIKLEGTNEHMDLTPDRIKSKEFQISTRKFKSHYPPYDDYELIDFSWKPVFLKSDTQPSLFDTV